MLKKLRIKNFKSFQDTDELEIKPITIFVGPNSSGKSTILKSLLLLRQTIDSSDVSNPLVTNGGWVSIGAYPEFIYNGESDRDLEISFDIEVTPFKEHSQKHNVHQQSIFTYVKSRTRIRLKESNTIYQGAKQKLKIKSKSSKYYSLKIEYKDKKSDKNEFYSDSALPHKFYNFLFTDKIINKNFDFLTDSYFINFNIENFFKNLFYIGPLRESPKRIYLTSGDAPEDVGQRGERAVDALWFSHLSEKKNIENLEDITRKWFKNFDFSSDITLNRLSKEGINYELLVKDEKTGFNTNIADVGFGVSQTLPIIIESFYAPKGSIILIEQPEIHLHPKAQAILGDLFIEASLKKDRQFIIETHSEHLLSRIRRRIAENSNFSNEDIAIYYFTKTENGSNIERIKLNEYGQFENFPKGFFEEGYNEALEHMRIITEKSKR